MLLIPVLGIEAVAGVVGHQVVAGRCIVGDVDGAAVRRSLLGMFWFAHIAEILHIVDWQQEGKSFSIR